MNETTLVKFENNSVNGIDRMYGKFRLKITGHAIGDKAVLSQVPDGLLEDITDYLKRNRPAIVITLLGTAKAIIPDESAVQEDEPVNKPEENPAEDQQNDDTTSGSEELEQESAQEGDAMADDQTNAEDDLNANEEVAAVAEAAEVAVTEEQPVATPPAQVAKKKVVTGKKQQKNSKGVKR